MFFSQGTGGKSIYGSQFDDENFASKFSLLTFVIYYIEWRSGVDDSHQISVRCDDVCLEGIWTLRSVGMLLALESGSGLTLLETKFTKLRFGLELDMFGLASFITSKIIFRYNICSTYNLIMAFPLIFKPFNLNFFMY